MSIKRAVIIPTALYGATAWVMRSAERKKFNVLEMKCLRSSVGVSGMYRVRNECQECIELGMSVRNVSS